MGNPGFEWETRRSNGKPGGRMRNQGFESPMPCHRTFRLRVRSPGFQPRQGSSTLLRFTQQTAYRARGGTGIRAGLRSRCPHGRVSSTLTARTNSRRDVGSADPAPDNESSVERNCSGAGSESCPVRRPCESGRCMPQSVKRWMFGDPARRERAEAPPRSGFDAQDHRLSSVEEQSADNRSVAGSTPAGNPYQRASMQYPGRLRAHRRAARCAPPSDSCSFLRVRTNEQQPIRLASFAGRQHRPAAREDRAARLGGARPRWAPRPACDRMLSVATPGGRPTNSSGLWRARLCASGGVGPPATSRDVRPLSLPTALPNGERGGGEG